MKLMERLSGLDGVAIIVETPTGRELIYEQMPKIDSVGNYLVHRFKRAQQTVDVSKVSVSYKGIILRTEN